MSDLNPGIRRLVAWLNDLNYRTVDSGDGETHDFECDRPYPYVVIQIETPAHITDRTDELKALLESKGVCFDPGHDRSPNIQANYSPVDGLAFIEVHNLVDSMIWPLEEN